MASSGIEFDVQALDALIIAVQRGGRRRLVVGLLVVDCLVLVGRGRSVAVLLASLGEESIYLEESMSVCTTAVCNEVALTKTSSQIPLLTGLTTLSPAMWTAS